MPRGGKRANAGRRPKLSDLDRIRVATDCEKAWQMAMDARELDAWRSIKELSDVDSLTRSAQRNLLREGRSWLQTEAREAHTADMDIEVEELRQRAAGTGAEQSPSFTRLVTVIVRRPYGVRASIMAEVANAWSSRLGIPISVATVKKCWDDHRRAIRICEATD